MHYFNIGKQMKEQVKDHLGNTYSSIADMCRFYKVNPDTYSRRIKLGWSVERALTEPTNRYSCKDHLGNIFSSERKMCEFYNINYQMYQKRIKYGWSQKDALTIPKEKKRQKFEPHPNSKCCYDMNGKYFNSITDMAKYYNLDCRTLASRIARGWTIEKALTNCLCNSLDYQGVHYNSLSALCRESGLTLGAVKARIARGWTLEEALGDKQHISRYYYDHLGNEFTSLKSLVEKYGITEQVYYRRKNKNWPLEQILQVPVIPIRYKKFKVQNSRHQMIKNNDEYYFPCVCLNCNNRYLFTKDQMDEHYEECSKKIYKII